MDNVKPHGPIHVPPISAMRDEVLAIVTDCDGSESHKRVCPDCNNNVTPWIALPLSDFVGCVMCGSIWQTVTWPIGRIIRVNNANLYT